jgi:hypothetical protein
MKKNVNPPIRNFKKPIIGQPGGEQDSEPPSVDPRLAEEMEAWLLIRQQSQPDADGQPKASS